MSQEYRIDGNLLTNRVRITSGGLVGGVEGLPSSAWYGEPMTAGVIVDDPLGELDLLGWHTFTHDETSCTTRPRTFTGWLTGRVVSRGPYKDGVARIWDCDIIDQNALFSFEVFRAASAKRPAETDIVRAEWALASAPMAGTPVANNGRANFTDNPTIFSDADYVTQFPVELFTSIAGTSGKNFYAYWDDDEEEISLHYDLVGSNPLSSLAISNVIADSDSTTFYPFLDGQLSRSPEGLYTGILFGYKGAYVYARRQETIDALSPTEFSPVNFLRDLVYRTDRVGKQDTAEALVQQQLIAHSVEQDTITCKVRLPAAQVNLLHAGDSVDVTFTHLPGYETATQVDVIRRNVIPSPGRRDFYDVTLELSNAVNSRGPGGGDPGDFPPPSCVAPPFIQKAEDSQTALNLAPTFDVDPTDGNLLVMFVCVRSETDTTTPDGWTAIGPDWEIDPSSGGGHKTISFRWFYKFASGDGPTPTFTATDAGLQTYACMAEFSGVDQFDGFDLTEDDTDQNSVPGPYFYGAGPMVPAASRVMLMVCGFMASLNPNDNWFPSSTDAFAVELGASGVGTGGGDDNKTWVGYKSGGLQSASPSGAVFAIQDFPASGNSRGYASMIIAFSGPCDVSDIPPGSGQIVARELIGVGDGMTVEFTTMFPYADGTLRVWVDAVEIINGLTETDPAAGTFTLDFAPLGAIGDSAAERITASYKGR